MGTYVALPGRIVMNFGALMLPILAVTGWLIYLHRRPRSSKQRSAYVRARTDTDSPRVHTAPPMGAAKTAPVGRQAMNKVNSRL
jgi:sulfite reductase (NADPH) flavoprotein alpha-component